MTSALPVPSSSWVIGEGGRVARLWPDRRRSKASAAMTRRQRAEVTCSACGKLGHNAKNRKHHPEAA
jgi:hypothetical protein